MRGACALQLLIKISCMYLSCWPRLHIGLRHAALLEEARKKIGSTPLEVAAQDFPLEAWRVWANTFSSSYTEDSEVCTAYLSQCLFEALYLQGLFLTSITSCQSAPVNCYS